MHLRYVMKRTEAVAAKYTTHGLVRLSLGSPSCCLPIITLARSQTTETDGQWLPLRPGHVDGIKQAMLRFNYDEHQGGRLKKGARAQEPETLKIDFVQDFNALTSDKAKLKTLEG